MSSQANGQRSGKRRAMTWLKVVIAIGVVGGLGASVLGVLGGNAGGGSDASSVELATATVMDFDITTIATGELEARRSVEVRSQVGTRSAIIELVPEGSRVKKGDVLVALNGEELDDQIKRQVLEVESARADLITAENELKNQQDQNASDLRKAELAVTIAELELEQWKKDFDKRRLQLENELDRARRNLDRLTEQLTKVEKLLAEQFASEDEVKQLQIQKVEAEGRLEVAKAELLILNEFTQPKEFAQANSKLTEAKAELERVKRSNEIQLLNRQAALDNRREQLKGREEQLAKLQQQLENCVMRAPTDGLVLYATSREDRWDDSRGTLQIGRDVAYRELLIILPDTSEMMASVRVHESIAGRVEPGQSAKVKVDALGGAVLTGVVESTGVLPNTGGWRDPNRREYTVKIRLEPGEYANQLKPSMRAEAEIQLGRVEGALAVPLQAIFRDGAATFVYRPVGTKFERQLVQVGRRSDMFAEITSGLNEGDRVLVREPRPSEIAPRQWTNEELAAVGLERDASGTPVPIGAAVNGVETAPGEMSREPGGERPERVRGEIPANRQPRGVGGTTGPSGNRVGAPQDR